MAETFGETLARRIEARGPLAVGLDPSSALLERWGLEDSADGALHVGLTVIEAVAESVAALKPQVAFFERFGAAGYGALERIIAEARAAGVLVVADAKRGDIGSTNEAYARAWLGAGPLGCDAMTLSPYLGVGALGEFVDAARASGRGLFVLARTSNDEGAQVQLARDAHGRTVAESVLSEIASLNARRDGRGAIGAVVGATQEAPRGLAEMGGPLLVPGLGAQGARPADAARVAAGCPRATVLASVSRAILAVGPRESDLTEAVQRWRDELSEKLL